jgi:hypothetical protein
MHSEMFAIYFDIIQNGPIKQNSESLEGGTYSGRRVVKKDTR